MNHARLLLVPLSAFVVEVVQVQRDARAERNRRHDSHLIYSSPDVGGLSASAIAADVSASSGIWSVSRGSRHEPYAASSAPINGATLDRSLEWKSCVN